MMLSRGSVRLSSSKYFNWLIFVNLIELGVSDTIGYNKQQTTTTQHTNLNEAFESA